MARVSNTQTPCLSAQWINAAKAAHFHVSLNTLRPGLEVIKLEFVLKLKIKCKDWMLADMCPQAANRYALF